MDSGSLNYISPENLPIARPSSNSLLLTPVALSYKLFGMVLRPVGWRKEDPRVFKLWDPCPEGALEFGHFRELRP
jgi:hypothetical protein